MLGEIIGMARQIYDHGHALELFTPGLFDEMLAATQRLPTSHFYGRRFGFQVSSRVAFRVPPLQFV